MTIDQYAVEMDGKISLLDNRKFVYSVGFIAAYYIVYLGYLTHLLLVSGVF